MTLFLTRKVPKKTSFNPQLRIIQDDLKEKIIEKSLQIHLLTFENIVINPEKLLENSPKMAKIHALEKKGQIAEICFRVQ